jgi:hypothetical protein
MSANILSYGFVDSVNARHRGLQEGTGRYRKGSWLTQVTRP